MSRETQQKIREICNELADFLCEKNKAYGDSAVNPVRIRSTASPIEQIRVRQDDKLNRIINGGQYAGDDDMKDLVGYWVLEQVAIRSDDANLSAKGAGDIHKQSCDTLHRK